MPTPQALQITALQCTLVHYYKQ